MTDIKVEISKEEEEYIGFNKYMFLFVVCLGFT
jgi:hypothetical protein